MVRVRTWLQGAVAAVLCVALVMPGDIGAEQPGAPLRKPKKAQPAARMTPEQKTLQALNRLTFGPRSGDVAAVDRMGLEAWFEQQLNPEAISDAGLETRLAKFPAMRLSQAELVERFPTPGMLRQYSRGGLTAPEDSVEQAIYADASLSYEEKKEAKRAKGAAPAAPPAAMADGMSGGVSASGATATEQTVVQAGTPAPVVRRGPEGDRQVAAGEAGMPAVVDTEVVAWNPAAKDTLLALPPSVRWERLVAMTPAQMQSLQAALKGPDQQRLYAGMTPQEMELTAAMKSPERMVGAEALSVRLLRNVYSERQLQAVMADFWLNHFSVYLRKNQNEPYLLPAYERDAILPNALGKFEDLLVATAESPAMLVYLDNWESIGPDSKAAERAQALQQNRPGMPLGQVGSKNAAKGAAKMPKGINENYARELMELHTLGVNGGYTQQDVIEVAKCFTGWTIDRPAQGGEFLFNPNRHEPGPKTVLGHVIQEGGMNEGLQVLHLLATRPSTAHFVSLKLAQRFVSDTPAPALVDRMAATFLKSDGDIKAVLTTMFHSPEFWSSGVYRAKVKTPVEFVASALRATDADVVNPLPLVQALDRLGMPIYGMQTPNGYPWDAGAWVSSNALLTRMNFALVLAGNRLPGTRVSWPALLGEGVNPTVVPDEAEEERLETTLLGEPAAPRTREAALAEASAPGVQQQAEQNFRATPVHPGNPVPQDEDATGAMLRVKAARRPGVVNLPETPLATMAGLLLGSPDFQRR